MRVVLLQNTQWKIIVKGVMGISFDDSQVSDVIIILIGLLIIGIDFPGMG